MAILTTALRRQLDQLEIDEAHRMVVPHPLVFSAWSFAKDDAAKRALHHLGHRGVPDLRIVDAAVLSWPLGQRRPYAWQECELGNPGSLSGAFWGLLISELFLLPLSAPEPSRLNEDGAAACTFERNLEHLGLDAAFTAAVRRDITPGTSALFIFDALATPDSLASMLPATARLVARRLLSGQQEANLRSSFED